MKHFEDVFLDTNEDSELKIETIYHIYDIFKLVQDMNYWARDWRKPSADHAELGKFLGITRFEAQFPSSHGIKKQTVITLF